jgi:hypothetical protein
VPGLDYQTWPERASSLRPGLNAPKSAENWPQGGDFGPLRECLTNFQHTNARVSPSAPLQGPAYQEYKAKYQRIRDRRERVIIDGICNSACTLVFGIVPMNKICVTPRASLGFHQAYYDKAFTFGIKVTSMSGTSDLMSYYPDTVKDWIRRNGGLTTEMKKIKNGMDLWKIVDPCPEDF